VRFPSEKRLSAQEERHEKEERVKERPGLTDISGDREEGKEIL